MLSLALALTLAQTAARPSPPREVAVLVSRRIGLSAARADAISAVFVELLKQDGFAVMDPAAVRLGVEVLGMREPSDCLGRRPCVSGLARVLKVWAAVAIDAALVDGNLALHLELIESEQAQPLVSADRFFSDKKYEPQLPEAFAPLLAALSTATERAAEDVRPPPSDAPKQVELAPTLAPKLAIEATAPPRGSVAPAVAVTVATAAAAVTSIVFLAIGLSEKAALDRQYDASGASPVYHLTLAEAEATAARSNGAFSTALGTGIGAGALGVLAAVLFAAR